MELDPKGIEKLAKEGSLENPIPYEPDKQLNPFEKYGNLQMFFVQDFAIETMKTYKNRKWWKLVVWQKEWSVEMISNDVVIKTLQSNATPSWSGTVKYCTANANQFDFSVNTWSEYTNESTREQTTDPNILEIVKAWIYEIEFAYWITAINKLWAIKFAIESNWIEVLKDKQERPQVMVDYNDPTKTYATPVTTISWYRKWYIELAKWDLIEFVTTANYSWSGSFTVDSEYTYRSIHYFSSNR